MNGALPAVVFAPAKLTRTLRLTGVRDDGYHLIDAEMVSLQWGDEVRFSAGSGLTVDGPFAAGVPTDERNLVNRALRSCAASVAVHLVKHVPHGGGLGGGSSDAAAVLRWAGVTDVDTAAALGADVPFCLLGGRARVSGIGEVLEALPDVDIPVTLVIPPLSVGTPAAYRAWDALSGPHGDHGNDLEPAAILVEPQLARWRDRIAEAAGCRPTLAGSGATWFVEADLPVLADALPDALVVRTRTGRR